MTLTEITRLALVPAFALLPPGLDTPNARVQLLATGGQESNFTERRQLVGNPPKPVGPAKSFWQAEQGGGMIRGVRQPPASKVLAAQLYKARGVPPSDKAIWDAIEFDDVLAAGLARLLLFTDPSQLPALGDATGAWALYLRTWRPGAWSRGTPDERDGLRMKWADKYQRALAHVTAS